MNLKVLSKMALLTVAVPMISARAYAWGDTGHEVVGEIAERILVNDEHTMMAIESIIGIEPLMIAATWADKVRSDERFEDFAPYHFFTYFRDPSKEVERDITTVFTKYPPLLIDSSVHPLGQGIALRYIIHMVGDAAQPLHSGNEFDRGANSCTVKLQPTADSKAVQTNLHKVWDTDLINAMINQWRKENPSIKYFGAPDIARILMAKHKDILSSATTINHIEWIKEGIEMEKAGVVYPDTLPEDARPYCNKRPSNLGPDEIPLLGPEYFVKSREIIEKQLVKGGVRLAAFLKAILKNRVHTPVDEGKILEDLKKKNKVN
jgi:hypothetical protein